MGTRQYPSETPRRREDERLAFDGETEAAEREMGFQHLPLRPGVDVSRLEPADLHARYGARQSRQMKKRSPAEAAEPLGLDDGLRM